MQFVNTILALFWTVTYGSVSPPSTTSSSPTVERLPARGLYEAVSSELKFYIDDLHLKEGYVLRLRSGFISEPRLVKVALNDQIIGYLPPCAGDWTEEVTYDIPKEFLVAGKNEIKFASVKISDWKLKDLSVEYDEEPDGEDIYSLAESAKVILEGLDTPSFSKLRLNTYLKKMTMLPLEEAEYEKYSRPFKLWLKELNCYFY